MGRYEILIHLFSKIKDINFRNPQSGDTLLINGIFFSYHHYASYTNS